MIRTLVVCTILGFLGVFIADLLYIVVKVIIEDIREMKENEK